MKIIRRWVDEQSLSAIDTVSASNRPKRQRRYSGVEKITIWNSCPKVQYRSSSPCGRMLSMSVVRNPRRTLWSDAVPDRRRPDFQVTPVVSIDSNLNTRPATLV